jgi:hypothetical protein
MTCNSLFSAKIELHFLPPLALTSLASFRLDFEFIISIWDAKLYIRMHITKEFVGALILSFLCNYDSGYMAIAWKVLYSTAKYLNRSIASELKKYIT